MTTGTFAVLGGRALLGLSGEDRRTFLQGLVSNDVTAVSAERAVYAALLTPQGRFLHDLFLVEFGDTLLLDGEAAYLGDLETRLSRYRLRARVMLGPVGPSRPVAVAFGEGALAALGLSDLPAGSAVPFGGDGLAYVDPRLPAAGARLVLPTGGTTDALAARGLLPGTPDDYDDHRLTLGLPDGRRDMVPEQDLLLECGFEELNGVDFKKGCYLGQETTARTRYRGLVRKRLVPVTLDGPPVAPGTPVLCGGEDAGVLRSGLGRKALALLRLEHLEAARRGETAAAGTRLTAHVPDWMHVPD
ncbi:MAG: YgfZ/GcvT domain-containing protein [Alphaproteobacteria bacterium]